MQIAQQLIFAILIFGAFGYAFVQFRKIWQNIKLGQDTDYKVNPVSGIKNMLLLAFGQKKMFQNMTPAILHGAVYLAFIVTQVELIEIFADGFFGKHRIFANSLGGLYTFIISFIEILSVGAFIATIIFLWRRNMLKVPRLVRHPEMNGWPKLDANLILIFEIILLIGIFSMNSADKAIQMNGYFADKYPITGNFAISSLIAPLLKGLPANALLGLERFGWWLHIIMVCVFLNYLPKSKHLHIMLAFPNAYFLDDRPAGRVRNMPAITNEVKLMLDPSTADPNAVPPEKFGAADVMDLSWKNLLDAYSCTECGRCTEACPANQTGKLLSPRKIMMDTRDRLEVVGELKRKEGSDATDGKALLGDIITKEEVMACTTCNACVQECPVSINPLNIIVELRRHLILEKADSPEEWNLMFGNIENNMAPWQFNPMDRLNWKNED